MTPQEVMDIARSQYNATGDTFFVETEMLRWITQGCQELAAKALTIRKIYTTTTVASTQEYALPSNIIAIKRMTYDGKKLDPYTFREDDSVTALNFDLTDTGTPIYYAKWDTSVFLRPIPDDAKTLKIFCYTRPETVTATSVIEVPEDYHHDIADYLVWRMALKDGNVTIAREYQAEWKEAVRQAKMLEVKKRRLDSFTHVQLMELVQTSNLGTV